MNSVYLLLSAAIPGMIWFILIWFTIPYKSVDIRSSARFFFMGVGAVGVVGLFLTFFPDYYDIPSRKDAEVFRLTFARIAPLEECIKISLFCLLASSIDRATHRSAFLAYGAVVGLGFGVVENVMYGQEFGKSVVVLRSFTSTVLHMGCGMVFAWFYTQSTSKQRKTRSRLDLIFRAFPRVKSRVFQGLGLLTCVWIHGYYNYTIIGKQPFGNTIFFLVLLVISTWIMSRTYQKDVNN